MIEKLRDKPGGLAGLSHRARLHNEEWGVSLEERKSVWTLLSAVVNGYVEPPTR